MKLHYLSALSLLIFSSLKVSSQPFNLGPIHCPVTVTDKQLKALEAGNLEINNILFLEPLMPNYYSNKVLPGATNILTDFNQRVHLDKERPHKTQGIVVSCNYKYSTVSGGLLGREIPFSIYASLVPSYVVTLYRKHKIPFEKDPQEVFKDFEKKFKESPTQENLKDFNDIKSFVVIQKRRQGKSTN